MKLIDRLKDLIETGKFEDKPVQPAYMSMVMKYLIAQYPESEMWEVTRTNIHPNIKHAALAVISKRQDMIRDTGTFDPDNEFPHPTVFMERRDEYNKSINKENFNALHKKEPVVDKNVNWAKLAKDLENG